MLYFPQSKINLGLYVTSKRLDGYHNLETCFYPIPFSDVLEVLTVPSQSEQIVFKQTGIAVEGELKDNLVYKAWALLAKQYSLSPLYIHLHKVVPMGAGLGGGSADAAATLVAINEICELGLNTEALATLAAELGSDCPFFIYNKPMIGRGRGTELSTIELSLKGWFLVLINPGVHISTKVAYSLVSPKPLFDESLEEILASSKDAWPDKLLNDFEPGVFKYHQDISFIKEELYNRGAVYASMSGSGSSFFGLFKNLPDVSSLEDAYPLVRVFKL